jgi:hypothetical protein
MAVCIFILVSSIIIEKQRNQHQQSKVQLIFGYNYPPQGIENLPLSLQDAPACWLSVAKVRRILIRIPYF